MLDRGALHLRETEDERRARSARTTSCGITASTIVCERSPLWAAIRDGFTRYGARHVAFRLALALTIYIYSLLTTFILLDIALTFTYGRLFTSEKDRDLNAAENLLGTVSSTNLRELKPVERNALASARAEVKRSSVKQELGPDQI